jgi:protein ImuB
MPLQLLLLRQPDWVGLPVAVVEEDRPLGLVTHVNALARGAGVLPGIRYGPALALLPSLRAGVVDRASIEAGRTDLFSRLIGFASDVEPSLHEPGVFWLDASGLGHLYDSLEAWAVAVRQDLRAMGWIAGAAIGFSRFGTSAAAKDLRGRGVRVFEDRNQEDAHAAGVPLDLVGLPPSARDALAMLGVQRVGELVGLPPEGIAKRFGAETHMLHRFASGDLELPLSPVVVAVPVEAKLQLAWGEADMQRLVFQAKPLVDQLLGRLLERGEALAELVLTLHLDGGQPATRRVRPAEATLASPVVMELVRLKLEADPPGRPVVELHAGCEAVPASAAQLAFFAEAPKRDLAAAARAFARLRAAFGEDTVAIAVPRDRHLPESAYAFEPLLRLATPRPRYVAHATLVRRLLEKPQPLSGQGLERTGGGTDGWLPRGGEAGAVRGLQGPYRLSGGWWRAELTRDYYFAELARGDLLWIYWDPGRRRWFLHGEVS